MISTNLGGLNGSACRQNNAASGSSLVVSLSGDVWGGGFGGRFRKRNLKHAKECSIQQRRGFACGVCRWKRRFGCSRNSAVSAARFERFSRTGRTRPALARPAFSRWLLENDRLRERWPCQWLNVLYFPFSETSPFGRFKTKLSPENLAAWFFNPFKKNLLKPFRHCMYIDSKG